MYRVSYPPPNGKAQWLLAISRPNCEVSLRETSSFLALPESNPLQRMLGQDSGRKSWGMSEGQSDPFYREFSRFGNIRNPQRLRRLIDLMIDI
jgi:hypothetical protein